MFNLYKLDPFCSNQDIENIKDFLIVINLKFLKAPLCLYLFFYRRTANVPHENPGLLLHVLPLFNTPSGTNFMLFFPSSLFLTTCQFTVFTWFFF